MADELDITNEHISITIDSSIQSIRSQVHNVEQSTICIKCKNEIDPKRSKVIKTNICVHCQQDIENQRRLYA